MHNWNTAIKCYTLFFLVAIKRGIFPVFSYWVYWVIVSCEFFLYCLLLFVFLMNCTPAVPMWHTKTYAAVSTVTQCWQYRLLLAHSLKFRFQTAYVKAWSSSAECTGQDEQKSHCRWWQFEENRTVSAFSDINLLNIVCLYRTFQLWFLMCIFTHRVNTFLEFPEMSVNSAEVRKKSGKRPKVREFV